MINDGPPTEPRPAASVLVLREGSPWEVLMMLRPGGSEFAPDAHVFPGGSVHAEDSSFDDQFRAAGVRELFEEMGLLIARRAGARATNEDAEHLRHRVDLGTGWLPALRSLGIELDLGPLAPLMRIVTPEQIRRRFDTWFFATEHPDGQEIHPHAGEVAGWRWISPAEALEGGITLLHPTRRVLERIAGSRSPGELLEELRAATGPVPTLRPRVQQRPDGGYAIVDV